MDQGPFPIINFVTPLKTPSPNAVTLGGSGGWGFQCMNFGKHNSAHVNFPAQMINTVEGKAWTRGMWVGDFCTYFLHLYPHAEARGVTCKVSLNGMLFHCEA